MKYIKLILKVSAVIGISFLRANEVKNFKPAANHVISFFVHNSKTGNVDPKILLSATYGGFIATTNHEGQIILPRKTESKKFYLVITPTLSPSFSVVNNVSHMQLSPKAKIYSIEAKDLKWIVKKEKISNDGHVPLHSVVIFANPSKIHMKEGSSKPLIIGEQLILPNIYADPNASSIKENIKLPNNKPFLSRIETLYSLTPYGYATIPAH